MCTVYFALSSCSSSPLFFPNIEGWVAQLCRDFPSWLNYLVHELEVNWLMLLWSWTWEHSITSGTPQYQHRYSIHYSLSKLVYSFHFPPPKIKIKLSLMWKFPLHIHPKIHLRVCFVIWHNFTFHSLCETLSFCRNMKMHALQKCVIGSNQTHYPRKSWHWCVNTDMRNIQLQ